MNLEPLAWHNELWNRWRNMVTAKRLGHAVLFVGQPGVGKQQFSGRAAAGLLCEQDGAPQAEPCGRCRGCTLFAAGSHPDSVLAAPADSGKTMPVDSIREIIQKVSLTAHYAGHKVVRIESADSMTLAASNALLKTLEEPPGDAVFILTSSRPSAVPITIRSRCQQWRVPEASREQAAAWLLQQGVSSAVFGELWPQAPGAPFQLLRMAQGEQLQQRRQLLSDARALLAARLDVVSAASSWRAAGARDIIEGLQRIVWQIARGSKLGGNSSAAAAASSIDGLHGFDALDAARASALYQALTEARIQLAGAGGVNETLLLERVAALWLSAGRASPRLPPARERERGDG